MKLPLLLLAVAGLSTAGSGGADSVRWAPAEILVRWAPGRAKVSRAGLRAVEVLQARYQLVEEGPLLPVRSRGRAKAPGGSGLERWSRLRFRTAEDSRTIAGEYASLELVQEAQPNYLRRPAWTPRDSLFPQQWSLTALGWQEAGPFDAQPVVVGVIDSGVDYDHPDIARQVWRNQPEVEGRPQVDDDGNGYVDDEVGWDFADAPGFPGDGDFLQPDADPQDESGHGTHVAGTIAAVTDNGKGIAAVAPQARVMVLRAGFNMGGGAYLEDDDIAAAMVYAADNGARVLNLSFGDPQFSPLLQDAARYARQAGCVLVGASGNEGQSPVVYPAGFAEAIAVGATGPDGQVLAFSSWGNALDLVAPGYEILSLAPGGGYARRSGTSMAAAHVSGLAALILARHPQFAPEQVRAALTLSARDVGPPGWDVWSGAGMGQAYAPRLEGVPAMRFVAPRPAQVVTDTALVEVEWVGGDGGDVVVSWGAGEDPTFWNPLSRGPAREGRPLTATWHAVGLAAGTYVLRAGLEWSGRTLEERVEVRIEQHGPAVTGWRVHAALDGAAWAHLAEWSTDIPSAGIVRLFRPGEGQALFEVVAPPQRREHRVRLPGALPAGAYRVALETRAGDLVTAVPDTLDLQVGQRSTAQWTMRPIGALPDGYLLSVPSDFDGDGRPEVVEMPYGNDRYNPVQFYAHELGAFRRVHTTALLFIPWTLCDLDGDTRMELLGVDAQRVRLLEPLNPGGFPQRVVWEQPDSWGGQAADLDQDGRFELFLRSGQGDVLRVYRAGADDALIEVAALANPTPGMNSLAERLVLADLDQDGWGEVVAGDDDGDLFAYESAAAGAFRPTWHEQGRPHEQVEVLGGGIDLDGDGRPELVAARFLQDPFDLSQARWRIGVYEAGASSAPRAEWEIEALGGKPGGNGFAAGDLDGDGRPEFALALVPNLYVFKNAGPDQYEVVWQDDAGDTRQPLAADLDGDGQSELLFSAGGQVRAWTRERPPGGLEAPAGVVAGGLADGRVALEWEAVTGAAAYRVYRGRGGFELIARVDQPRFRDDRAAGCPGCDYAVAAEDAAGQEGLRSQPARAAVEPPPRVVSVERLSPGQLGVLFTAPMRTSNHEPSAFRVDPRVGAPSSVAPDRGGQRVVLGFVPDLPDSGAFTLVLEGLRSVAGTPLDSTSRRVDFALVSYREPSRLLEGRAQSATRIVLRFSQPVVLPEDPAKAFTIGAGGLAVAAVSLENADREALLELDPQTPLRPLGRGYLVQVRGLQDRTGRRVHGEVLVRFAAADLDRVTVFPNPFRPSRGRLTFGSLPAQAQVFVYDLSGRWLRTLTEEDGDGGAEWDGTDHEGDPAPSGVLLYQARSHGRTTQGRFALIRD